MLLSEGVHAVENGTSKHKHNENIVYTFTFPTQKEQWEASPIYPWVVQLLCVFPLTFPLGKKPAYFIWEKQHSINHDSLC